jgi:hypothetical protein
MTSDNPLPIKAANATAGPKPRTALAHPCMRTQPSMLLCYRTQGRCLHKWGSNVCLVDEMHKAGAKKARPRCAAGSVTA